MDKKILGQIITVRQKVWVFKQWEKCNFENKDAVLLKESCKTSKKVILLSAIC